MIHSMARRWVELRNGRRNRGAAGVGSDGASRAASDVPESASGIRSKAYANCYHVTFRLPKCVSFNKEMEQGKFTSFRNG